MRQVVLWSQIRGFFKLLVCCSAIVYQTCSFALPSFANQTGQNCMACHAGGQYPELTPYGRLFKLTGYTLGEKTLSVSVMGVAGASKVKNIDAVNNASYLNTPLKNGTLDFETGSVFLAGKISDNVGAFTQLTYDKFGSKDANGNYTVGTTGADSMDIRYADQIVTPSRNLIYGVSLNNKPSVSDPWNTSAAWMQYVPQTAGKGANTYTDATTAYPSNGLTGLAAGLTAYAFLDKTYYAELGFYKTANNLFSILNTGNDPNYLTSTNPYWRLAYNKEWGADNLMVGISGTNMHYLDPNATGVVSDPNNYLSAQLKGVDAQYQYLLDPHTVTFQGAFQKQTTNYALNNTTNTSPSVVDVLRLKGSYIYQAKYGASAAYFNYSDGSLQGGTYEVFYMPLQNLRVGLQYTAYSKLTAITSGSLALASDANTFRLYVWVAY